MFIRRFTSRVIIPAFLACTLLGGIAHAGTIVRAKASGIGSLATAQIVDLDPILVLRQKMPNDSLATAQPVSPTYMAREIVGTLTQHQRQAFFGFAVAFGVTLHIVVRAKDPTQQFPEALLYQPDGSLVAAAIGNGGNGSDAIIDFTTTVSGTWFIEATGSPSVPPSEQLFTYDLRITPVAYVTDVRGRFSPNNRPGFYAIATNVGDVLHLTVSANKPDKQKPELLLYDNFGNLVAIANGNGGNGSDSIIDFTVPAGEGGTWVVEVTGSPTAPDPAKNHFPYLLTIQGATGAGPVIPR